MPLPFLQLGDFLRCGGQARTVSPVDITTAIASQLTYCVEVAAELLADVEEQTVRSVHQAQRPGRESPLASYALEGIEAVPVDVVVEVYWAGIVEWEAHRRLVPVKMGTTSSVATSATSECPHPFAGQI